MEDTVKIAVGFGIFFIVMGVLNHFTNGIKQNHKTNTKLQLTYKHKDFLMTHAEHEFFKKLELAVGDLYYVFPQVHLSSIVDNKVVGQSWKSSFNHINGKSVDFVICDKGYCKPLLAIELDDYSHDREDRKFRDAEVERILQQAQLRLLRFPDGSEEIEVIRDKILQDFEK